jgi:bifunctional polynucleotide phosphatase/kinase
MQNTLNTDFIRKESVLLANTNDLNIIEKLKYVENIYMFDLDSTLIKTKSGKKFGITADDYIFIEGTLDKLKKLYMKKENLVVILSNQGGIKNNLDKENVFKDKLSNIFRDFYNILTFVACDHGAYRKPNIGMFLELVKLLEVNDKQLTDIKSLHFIGDAAGRISDFSCSDRKLTENISMYLEYLNLKLVCQFYEPEVFFNSSNISKFSYGFDPKSIIINNNQLFIFPPMIPVKNKEVIFLVGAPATGKTTFYNKYLKDAYLHINQDTLKTKQKCMKALKDGIKRGCNICIDNTNGSMDTRKYFIDEIKKNSEYRIRGFVLYKTRELTDHLNIYRHRKDVSNKLIPSIVYNIYYKHYIEPTYLEGFNNIIKVPFVPEFEDRLDMLNFIMYS